MLACGLAFGMPAFGASSSASAAHLRVDLMVPGSSLYSDAQGNLAGLYFKLDPGWHVYWENAGDAGEPPTIHWTLPKGVTAGPLEFPAPQRLPVGPLMDYGYPDDVMFPFKLHVAPGAQAGPAVLDAQVNWLVCSSVCIPGKAELQITRNVVPGAAPPTAATPPLFQRFLSQTPKPLPAGDKAVFQTTPVGFRLAVHTGRRETEAAFFPSDQSVVDNPAPQLIEPTAQGLVLTLKKDLNISGNPAHLNGVLELSGGRNYQIAAMPGKVAALPAGSVSSFGSVGNERPSSAGTAAVPASSPASPLGGFLSIVGLAFLGGLLLNLMPCVFPVLFLKGLALVNSGAEERHKLRAHGFVYTAGIVVSFWALVAALLGLRAAGATLGWGFQFQSPVFLFLLDGLFFFLGLSLAGQFEIGLSLTSAGGSLAARQGYAGSFFTGVLAVVVATPCTAPFMAAAIAYALAQPIFITFAVFTALALGLASPYVALTLQPAWTRWLPKPGAWMDVLKQGVSLFMFGTVIWLTWVVAQAYGANTLLVLLSSLLLVAVAGWFLGRWPARRWATGAAVAVLLAVIGLAVAGQRVAGQGTTATSQATASAGGPAVANVWQPWSPQAVSQSLTQGRPVFVDFTASWCLSCQVNERVALSRAEVMRAFHSANVALLKADWTRQDAAITKALAALGRDGVPVYALYTPGQSTPQLLPQVLTPGIVIDALAKLPHTAARAGAATAGSL